MPDSSDAPRGTRPRRGESSYDERRDALAESALRTLGALGYARASLREIAANSEFSHGAVHYYFRDKTELIIYGIRQYKARCVHRYDGVVETSQSADQLQEGFADKLVETALNEAAMHRLWYDLRTQSMFDDGLRADVTDIDNTLADMVWRVLGRYAELAGRPIAVPPSIAYAMLDGIFEQALRGHLAGDQSAVTALRERVVEVLPMLLAAPAERR